MEEKTTTQKESVRLYELGFILNPQIEEARVGEEAAKIKAVIESDGGVIVAEELPKYRALSYTMIKRLASGNNRVSSGYFGWVKFESEADSLSSIDAAAKNNENIIRYIMIKTVKDSMYVQRSYGVRKMFQSNASKPIEGVPAERKAVSDEELDKSIEKLVAE